MKSKVCKIFIKGDTEKRKQKAKTPKANNCMYRPNCRCRLP